MVYNKERVRDASTFQKVRQYEFPTAVRRMVYNKERVRDASTFQKVRQYEFPTASYLIPVSMWRK